jgi:predicted nucleic acid-binding protein
MNVYVETNFILELAFAQDEYANCDRILGLCEAGHAALVLPAFCVAESYETLGRRKKRRERVEHDLKEELRQLERSEPYRDRIAPVRKSVEELLILGVQEDDDRMTAVLDRVLRVAKLVPLEASVISRVESCRETYKLEPQDSIVYLSVLSHLESEGRAGSCFVTRDTHFADRDLVESLTDRGCTVFFGFREGCCHLEGNCDVGSSA